MSLAAPREWAVGATTEAERGVRLWKPPKRKMAWAEGGGKRDPGALGAQGVRKMCGCTERLRKASTSS